MVDADVNWVLNDCPNACPPPKGGASFGFDATLIQILRYPVCPVSVIGQQIKDFPDNLGLIFIDHQIPHRLILFVGAALMLQLVTIWEVSSPVLAFLHHLTVLGLNMDGRLFAFAGCLPEADVVQQFVYMIIEPLLAFPGTPDLDALLDKPLNHEGCFMGDSLRKAQSKKKRRIRTKNKKNWVQPKNRIV